LPGQNLDIEKYYKLWWKRFKHTGNVVSQEISRPSSFKWGALTATEDQEADEVSITYYVRGKNPSETWTSWYEIENGAAIPNELAAKTVLQWKAELSTTSNIVTPWIYGISISSYSLGFPGFSTLSNYNNRLYILGIDDSEEALRIVYDPMKGFLRFTDEIITPWQLYDFRNVDGTRYIGSGEYNDVGAGEVKGVLLYELDVDNDDYIDNSIEVETGHLLLGEVPKKVRKVFLTYQGTGVHITIYTHGYEKTFNLEDSDEFVVKELNLATPRSKWIKFKIWATSGFKMKKELYIGIKAYKQDEKGG
jgi:hypothetical protein